MAGFRWSNLVVRPIEEVARIATDVANVSPVLPGVTKVERMTEGVLATRGDVGERDIAGEERTVVVEIVEDKCPELHADCFGGAVLAQRQSGLLRTDERLGVRYSWPVLREWSPAGAGSLLKPFAQPGSRYPARPGPVPRNQVRPRQGGVRIARLHEAGLPCQTSLLRQAPRGIIRSRAEAQGARSRPPTRSLVGLGSTGRNKGR